MAHITGLPAPQRRAISNFKDASTAFSYVENGLISPVNDTLNELVGSQLPSFYVKIVEGAGDYSKLTGVSGTPLGGAYHENPVNQQGTMFAAFGDDKIYKIEEASQTMVRDVSADGYEIKRMCSFQTVRFLYVVIGDGTASAKVYRYDPSFGGTITAFGDYSGTVVGAVSVTCVGHGLVDGATIAIPDTVNYEGIYVIIKIDADTFYIMATWVATETGTFTSEQLELLDATGLIAGGRLITGMENRLLIFSGGEDILPGQYSTLDPTMDNTIFTSGTGQSEGGDLAGGLIDVRAAIYFKGLTFAFEKQRITVHRIGDPFSNLTTLIKDNNTLEEGYSVEGRGTSSMEGVTIGRGEIFYVDEYSGVFSYSSTGSGDNARIGGKELSAPIHSTIVGYDLSSAAIKYHPLEDILMVACSSQAGGLNDTVFYYSFQTKAWSKDTTKFISKFIWHAQEGQMYGLSSISAKVVKVFDGTYFDEFEDKIEMIARSQYFEGGRRSQEKEYIDSSVIIGVPTLVEDFSYSLYVNSETVAQTAVIVDVTDFSSPGIEALASGPWGVTLFGGGSAKQNEDLSFVQYYNDDLVDDHRRIAVEIKVSPGAPFAIFAPEIVTEVIDESSDDFL